MSNLVEQAVWVEGIYQLETTDPVEGGPDGIDNLQAKQLANRTAFLKEQVEKVIQSTGELATPEFVLRNFGGVMVKSVAAATNIVLSAIEAANGILVFSGVLKGNTSVTVQADITRQWVLCNRTSGNFTLTIKTQAGNGISISQGKSTHAFTDGVDVLPVISDFNNINITGPSTAVTPAAGDNSSQIATTEFIQSALGGILSKSVAGKTDVVLTVAEAGNGCLILTGALTGNVSLIVPVKPTFQWIICNRTTGDFVLTVKTSNGTGVSITRGKNTLVFTDGVNVQSGVTDLPINPLSSATSYNYTNGMITSLIETINGVQITKSFTFNTDGTINTVSYPNNGKTRTETYTYTGGFITGYTATEV